MGGSGVVAGAAVIVKSNLKVSFIVDQSEAFALTVQRHCPTDVAIDILMLPPDADGGGISYIYQTSQHGVPTALHHDSY